MDWHLNSIILSFKKILIIINYKVSNWVEKNRTK